jgi:hypothetical protein
MNVRPILVGELGLISLFDLVQLFLLSGATGTLRVASSGRQGHFRFERGQVAGARDDQGPDGSESAYRLFAWRTGTFAFNVGTHGSDRTIDESTEGLMMEAARRMDESGATHASPFHSTTLQARVQALTTWRASLEKLAPGITAPFAEVLGLELEAAAAPDVAPDAAPADESSPELRIVQPPQRTPNETPKATPQVTTQATSRGKSKGPKRRGGKGYRDAA